MKLTTVEHNYQHFLESFSRIEKEKSSEKRKDLFTQALKATVQHLLVQNEASSTSTPKRFGHLAQELVSLSKLKERIQRISGCIQQEEDSTASLQLLATYTSIELRANQVKSVLRSVTDFYFSHSKALKSQLEVVSKVLKGEDLSYGGFRKTESIIFHFLALNPFSNTKKKFNQDYLEGQSAHQSLCAFLKVWELYIKIFYSNRISRTQEHIVKLLNGALSCALRSDFITDNWCATPYDDESYEMLADFYPSFAALEKVRQQFPQKSLTECIESLEQQDQEKINQFFEKPLEENLSNDLLLDCIVKTEREALQKLEEGQSKICLLGSYDHCIVCQFKRDSHSSYSLTIYNPSYYTTKGGHERKEDGEQSFVKPLKIKELTLENLTDYQFLHRLWFICCEENVENDKVALFYNHLKSTLVESAGGKVVKEEGVWFPIPQYGICTTASIMMFLANQLDSTELSKIERAMLVYCYNTQAVLNKAIKSHSLQLELDEIEVDLEQEMKPLSQREMIAQADFLSTVIQERVDAKKTNEK